MTKLVLSEI